MTPYKQQRVKARTCQLILTEGQFDMSTWTGAQKDNPDEPREHPACGTACCIAGNMIIAAREERVCPKARPWWHSAGRVEYLADEIWKSIGPAGTDLDSVAIGMMLGDITPQMAVAHVMTGTPLRQLAADPAAVRAGVRAARRLIREAL